MTKPRAAIYARISSADKDVPAIENQTANCRALAEKSGYEVVNIFSDDGKSAYKAGVARDGLVELMVAIDDGFVDVVLAVHQDRLSRDEESALALKVMSAKRGVLWHFTDTGKLDPGTAEGGFLASINAAVARYDSHIKAERIRRSVADRLAKGLDLGGPRPFGFEKDRKTIREAEADLIRKAVADILAEKATVRSVAKAWTDAGVQRDRSPNAQWRSQSVRHILLRPRNVGRLVVKGVEYPSDLPRIIEEDEDFHALVKILTNPDRAPKRGPEPGRWAALTTLRCATCGSYLSGRRSSTGKPEVRCAPDSRPTAMRGERHATMLADPLEGQLSQLVLIQVMQRRLRNESVEVGSNSLAALRLEVANIVEQQAQATAVAMLPGANMGVVGQTLSGLQKALEGAQAALAARLANDATERAMEAVDAVLDELLASATPATEDDDDEQGIAPEVWNNYWNGLPVSDRRTLVQAMLPGAKLLPAAEAWGGGFRVDFDGSPRAAVVAANA